MKEKKDYLKYTQSIAGVTKSEVEDYMKWTEKFQGVHMSNAHDIISHKDGIVGMTPNVIEENPKNMAVIDVFSRLMKDRIIFLGHGITDQVSNIIVSQMLFLEQVDSEAKIDLYINSGGGSVYAGLGILGTMMYIKPKVSTITTGLAASMAYVLAAAGEHGMRYALPYARLMQHQPLGGAQGQATDIEITNIEIQKLKFELYELIAHFTGQTIEKIYEDCERDFWMRAEEAKAYGVIDKVIPLSSSFTPSPMKDKKWKEFTKD